MGFLLPFVAVSLLWFRWYFPHNAYDDWASPWNVVHFTMIITTQHTNYVIITYLLRTIFAGIWRYKISRLNVSVQLTRECELVYAYLEQSIAVNLCEFEFEFEGHITRNMFSCDFILMNYHTLPIAWHTLREHCVRYSMSSSVGQISAVGWVWWSAG